MTIALVVGTLVLAPSGADAATADGPDLSAVTSQEIADSVHDIDQQVSHIDLAESISPLETETTSGGSATISLNSDILFGFDAATISPAATTRLTTLVEDVPRGARVTITGYTDDIGEDAYNRSLSTRRATAVQRAVRTARPDLKTTATGRGSADPVEPNTRGGEDNPQGRAKNRRVEITWKR